jgi:glyoxylase-like metal-dependent hydrolase (beta-lactamase superfamily II)
MAEGVAQAAAPRLYLFGGGSIRVPRSAVNLGDDRDVTVAMPVQWYLFVHPRGTAVIDGGSAPQVAVDAGAHLGDVVKLSDITMAADEAIVPAMRAAGFDPASVRWIVQTHLHWDHTGALATIEHFPNAEVLVTRREHRWAHHPPSFAALGYAQADYVKAGVPWVLLEDHEDGYDLFGDGTLRCWWTPGHTPGHMSIEIGLGSGVSLMLAADAINNLDHLSGRWLPAFAVSMDDAVRSIERLRRLAWRSDAVVVAGHDPTHWASLRHAPEGYA